MGIPQMLLGKNLTWLRIADIQAKLEQGMSARSIVSSWTGSVLGMRWTSAFSLIREVKSGLAAGFDLSPTPAKDVFNTRAFATSDRDLPHKYYIDADVVIQDIDTGAVYDSKRRIWFDDVITQEDYGDMLESSVAGYEGDYGQVLKSFKITGAYKRRGR